ncbi:MAG: YopX family protein [Thermincolia bacterium]
MREYKFRGKRVDNGEWVYGYLVGSPVDALNTEKYITKGAVYQANEVDPETVGQYTGLTDSTKWDELTEAEQNKWLGTGKTAEEWNGKEIFEGDIDACDVPMVVCFEDGMFGLKFSLDDDYFDFCIYWKKTKIIGNIHDHFYLLGGV